jgi:hypothetical protein
LKLKIVVTGASLQAESLLATSHMDSGILLSNMVFLLMVKKEGEEMVGWRKKILRFMYCVDMFFKS